MDFESPPESRVIVKAVLGDIHEGEIRGLDAEDISINPSAVGVVPFPCDVKAKARGSCLGLVGDIACR